jgi:hypothetical protein
MHTVFNEEEEDFEAKSLEQTDDSFHNPHLPTGCSFDRCEQTTTLRATTLPIPAGYQFTRMH